MILGTLKQIGTQPEWFTDAVCPQVDPELFFDKALAPDAKRVCVNCPVRSECLRYAMGKSDLDGVWGGMTWEERRSVRLGHRGVASVSHCVACGRGSPPPRWAE